MKKNYEKGRYLQPVIEDWLAVLLKVSCNYSNHSQVLDKSLQLILQRVQLDARARVTVCGHLVMT